MSGSVPHDQVNDFFSLTFRRRRLLRAEVHKLFLVALTALAASLISGCKNIPPVRREIREVKEIASLHPDNKFIKAHMKDGQVYILHHWTFDTVNNKLAGFGAHLGVNRNIITRRKYSEKEKVQATPYRIALEGISLIETNDPGPSIAGGMGVVTGITAGFTFYCLTNPKACFGSCPTFYAFDGERFTLQAEGFSTSVMPSLEKNDIDMLYKAKPSRNFELIVTNEALETHSIRQANLLVFEKQFNERVFAAASGEFYRVTDIAAPVRFDTDQGPLLSKVKDADGEEYFSPSDSVNLDSKEEIFVDFNNSDDSSAGLIIGKRQTLLTTFLMYQCLAYMGNAVTYLMAEHERGKASINDGIFRLLGGIEVFSKDEKGNWIPEGLINETGPIAPDFALIPLSVRKANIQLKIRMNRGLWRVDYVALGKTGDKVTPLIIKPSSAETMSGSESAPLARLLDPEKYLVTYPGDSYRLKYDLPFDNAEVFLDSRGYYLEWIRKEWIKEQNFRKLNMLINKPARYLKNAANEYKKLEPSMEKTFWNSRYVQK